MRKVTDPSLLEALEAPSPKKVTDPDLLAQLNGASPTDEMTLSGFRKNLRTEVESIPKMAGAVGELTSNYFPMNIPKQIFKTVAGQPYAPPPVERDASILSGVAKELPGSIVESVTRLRNPVKAFYEKPITTAVDVATLGSVAKPIAQLGRNATTLAGEGIANLGIKSMSSLFEKPLGRRFLSAALGPSEEAIAERVARPQSILKATNEARIAEGVEKGYRTVEGKISDVEKRVGKKLRASLYLEEGATPKDQILSAIDNARKEIGFTVTPEEQYAKGILDNVSENLGRLRETVSEKQLRDLVQKVSNAIPFGAKEYGSKSQALMRLRYRLDSFLKKNPEYANLMREEVPLQRLKTDLIDDFGFKRSVGEGMKATDATASKLSNILNDTKEVRSQRILNRLKGVTGQDYIQQVRDWKVAEQFQPGMTRPQGSRRVNWGGGTGAAVGGMIGGLPGAAIGAVAGVMTGGYMDKQGGAIAAKLIDMYLNSKGGTQAAKAMNPIAAEYGPALVDAMEKTGSSIEEVTAAIRKSDPTFDGIIFSIINPDRALSIFKPAEKPKPLFKKSAKAEEEKPEKVAVKVLTEEKAREYLAMAGNDKKAARRMAVEDGWRIA